MIKPVWKPVRQIPVNDKRCRILVVRKIKGKRVLKGFFKFPSPTNNRQQRIGASHLLGSELIANKLARLLNLPVSTTIDTRIDNKSGILKPLRFFILTITRAADCRIVDHFHIKQQATQAGDSLRSKFKILP